jgi:hypothetical protein
MVGVAIPLAVMGAIEAAPVALAWALANPVTATGVGMFGIGVVDPHPPGASPLDPPGPDPSDLGRLTRAGVTEIGEVIVRSQKKVIAEATEQVVKSTEQQAVKAVETGLQGLGKGADEVAASAPKVASIGDQLYDSGHAALKTIRESKLAPVAASTLGRVGQVWSRRAFRREVAKILTSNPQHPLRFLLKQPGKLRSGVGKGVDEVVWQSNPELVEAAHVVSAWTLKQSKGADRFVVASTYVNRRQAATIEHASRRGSASLPEAIEIGGIPVDPGTAVDWVAKGLLKADVLAQARRITF